MSIKVKVEFCDGDCVEVFVKDKRHAEQLLTEVDLGHNIRACGYVIRVAYVRSAMIAEDE
jgi:hypothetical protein